MSGLQGEEAEIGVPDLGCVKTRKIKNDENDFLKRPRKLNV
jgi:hypothetical protein